MRLIDADALYNGAMKDEWFRFKERDNNGKESFAYSCAMQRLVEAPTVDVVVHGHWIYKKPRWAECSECHHDFIGVYDLENSDNYCRHCGAKMDEEAKA